MVKSWRPVNRIGGLFGGSPDGNDGLSWTRLQQSAFLLTAWKLLSEAVAEADDMWATKLREDDANLDLEYSSSTHQRDEAFAGPNTLLATDQGVRGYQSVVNDLCYVRQHELRLSDWIDESDYADVTPGNVKVVAESLESLPVYGFLYEVCAALATFDWRTSRAPGLAESERLAKAALRGSGGYKELREQLTRHLVSSGSVAVSAAAQYLEA